MIFRNALYIGLGLIILSSCSKDVGTLPAGGYPAEVSSIMLRNCAVSGCHTSQSSEVAGNLNLESWEAMFRGTSSGAAVVPFNSRFSPLMYFINTYPEIGLQSEPAMPLNREPLSRENVLALKRWIDKGAPDDRGGVMFGDDPARKKMYVVNQGCDVVSVLDAATGLTMRVVEVGVSATGDAPHTVKVSPDGQNWYVVFINSNYLQKFRCSDDAYIGEIPLTPSAAGLDVSQNAFNWNAFVISPDGKKAYCTSLEGKIAVVDLVNMRFVKWLGGQHFPHGIAINKAGDRILVTAQTGNFITELDSGLTFANEIPLEGTINYASSLDVHEIMFSPVEDKALVTCQKTNEVRVLDLTTGAVQVVPTGILPQEIVYDQLSNNYFVTCTGDTAGLGKGVVTVIDGTSFAARHISCGYQPHGLAVNQVTRELYVLSRNASDSGVPAHHGSVCNGRNGFVNFIDLGSLKVKSRSYELSVDPYFIVARP